LTVFVFYGIENRYLETVAGVLDIFFFPPIALTLEISGKKKWKAGDRLKSCLSIIDNGILK